MDILAHGLWAGVALGLTQQRWRLTRRTIAATVGLAVLPDLVHLLPILAWALFGGGSFAAVRAYALALPGNEPVFPPLIGLLSNHLHCVMHSAVVAGALTLLLWAVMGSFWIPLLGWWSHIIIDVFTHSSDFYPSPVFYPFTQWGFDGLAWNTPWFMVLNYALLATALVYMVYARRRQR